MNNADRRQSTRVQSRLYIRGIGADRAVSDCLGDLATNGVGFAFPQLPAAEDFQIHFACPGEQQLRRGYARIIDADPLPGTRDRQSPFFVHLKFTKLATSDYDALGRVLDRLAAADDEFDIDEAAHSLLPVRADSFTRVTLPRPRAPRPMPPTQIIVPSMLPTPAEVVPSPLEAMAEDALRPGFFSRCMWQYLTHGARATR